MALNIVQKFSVDLNGVVENSIAAVKAVRRSEQARKEAEFQRAIANGLSYENQVAMREKQLEDEKKSSISDPDYIGTLEKSITDTKKLNRFNKYRTKYAQTLGDLSAGKINEEQYLSTLKSHLGGIDDPDLRLEIQNDITVAEGKLKTYKDTILSNQVKKARYDGTKDALNEVIALVNTARAQALINDNEDEVTAYDETLSALQSQFSSVRIQDSITDFQVKSSTRGTNPIEKFNYINSEIQKADPNTGIKIGDRAYTSAQQFWNLERDNFLAGNSQIFGNFFQELDVHIKNVINANAVKFGYPTQTVLDEALTAFNELRTKPEMAPFVNRLDATRAVVMNEAVNKLAKQIVDIGSQNFDFANADVQLSNIQSRFGVNVDNYKTDLRNKSIALGKESQETLGTEEAKKRTIISDLPLPKVEQPPVVPSTAPTPSAPPPITPTAPVKPEVKQIPDSAPIPTSAPTPISPAPIAPVAPIPVNPVKSPAAAPTENYREVIVNPGETISGILNREIGLALSKDNQSKYDEVAKLSGIADANKIKPGQKIKIPI